MKKNTCIFNLRSDHNGDSYPKMNRYKHITTSNELTIEYPKSENDSSPHGDVGTLFLEYK